MTLRVLIVLAVPVLAICSPAGGHAEQPFVLEDIDFTPDCAPNAALDRLLGMLLGPPRDYAEPAFDDPLYDAVSATASHVLRLKREYDWHGLHLVEVRSHHGIESGPFNLSLVFADRPERVREVWNARGWNLPPVGETRVIEDDGFVIAAGIEPDGAFAAVTCFSD